MNSGLSWDERVIGYEDWTADSTDDEATKEEPRTFDRGYKA